jgi:probable addiction module antidote protein
MPRRTGKTTKPANRSRRFNAPRLLRNEAEVAAYIEAMLENGDARAVPVALRTVAESVGGMAVLANNAKLSRETLYRTLSERGNPRLDTLTAILAAYGMRPSVRSTGKSGLRRAAAGLARALATGDGGAVQAAATSGFIVLPNPSVRKSLRSPHLGPVASSEGRQPWYTHGGRPRCLAIGRAR